MSLDQECDVPSGDEFEETRQMEEKGGYSCKRFRSEIVEGEEGIPLGPSYGEGVGG